MSRRSRRNSYKKHKKVDLAPQEQESLPAPAAPATAEPDYRIVGPKKFRQENYRTEHTILFYSLLAFLVFVAIAVIIIVLIHKFAVQQIYS